MELEEYLEAHGADVKSVFGVAHFLIKKEYDAERTMADVVSYEQRKEIPDYVLQFLASREMGEQLYSKAMLST